MVKYNKNSIVNWIKNGNRRKAFLFIAIIAWVVLGSLYIRNTWTTTMNETAKRAMDTARMAEASLSKELIKKLDASAKDIDKLEYNDLKSNLMNVIKIDERIRFAYIYTKKAEKIYFIADSEPVESKDYSPPGQEYTEASNDYKKPFADGIVFITQPITDRWGNWISILVPMRDLKTGEIIAVFAIDYPAENWNQAAVHQTVQAGITVLALSLVLWAFGIILNNNIVLIREKKNIEHAKSELKKSEEKFSRAFHSNAALMAISTFEDGRFIDVNETFLKTLGYDRDEIINNKSADLNLFTDRGELREKIKKEMKDNDKIQNIEVTVKGKNGVVHGLFSVDSIDLGVTSAWLTTMTDITKQKAIEQQLLMKESMLKAIAEATKELLVNNDIVSAIENSLAIIGKATKVDRVYYFQNNYDDENCLQSFSQKAEWCSEDAEPQIDNPNLQEIPLKLMEMFFAPLFQGKPVNAIVDRLEEGEAKNLLKSQEIVSILILPIFVNDIFWGFVGFDECEYERAWTEDEIALLMSFTNSIIGAISRKEFENKIEYLSYHDQLTGLYNRRFYEKELKQLVTEKHLPITLVMADVNGLKLTNDAFGHNAGDIMLEKVASILKREQRDKDIVARISGDEFVLLLPQTDSENANEIVNRINAAIASEKVNNAILSVSIGFAVIQDMTDDVNQIFKLAEDEMYRQKLSESSSMRSKTVDLIINTLYEKNNREMLHSKRVSKICEAIATKMNLNKDDINHIRIAGLMHDIGKVGIDEKILNKTEKLSNDEWNEIKKHSEIGYRILSSVNEFSKIADYVLEHHEGWNGSGYPKGLKGEAILLQARIIAIADAFDAMTSDRTYRKALTEEEAINEIRRCSGTQFDPAIAKTFIEKVLGR